MMGVFGIEQLQGMSGFVFLAVLMVPFLTGAVNGQVVISQVLYDPVGTESGGEAVELHNTGNVTVDISDYALATGSSQTDAVIPMGSELVGGGRYLITDSGWDTAKDDPLWPSADHEEAITLKNSDSGVALVDALGNVVDAVGWGDVTVIDPLLFEGTPADEVSSAGHALVRIQDTGDNSVDVVEDTPTFQGSVPQGATVLSLTVEVLSLPPAAIGGGFADEDVTQSGVQIFPLPGQTKIVEFSVEAWHPDGFDKVQSVRAVIVNGSAQGDQDVDMYYAYPLSPERALFVGNATLDFTLTPRNYVVEVEAETVDGVVSSNTTTFTYLPLTALELDGGVLNCSVQGGRSCVVSGDNDMMTSTNPTLRNIGNTLLDIELYSQDLAGVGGSIPAENIWYRFGASPFAMLSRMPQLAPLGLGPAGLTPLSLQVDIPNGTTKGTYDTSITLMGIGQ